MKQNTQPHIQFLFNQPMYAKLLWLKQVFPRQYLLSLL